MRKLVLVLAALLALLALSGGSASHHWGASAKAAVQTRTLTVAKAGSGAGTVTSSPAGINCGSTCSFAYPKNTIVSLTASPGTGSTFAGWSGACSGTGICSMTMSVDRSVTATFNTVDQCSDGINNDPSEDVWIDSQDPHCTAGATVEAGNVQPTPQPGYTFCSWWSITCAVPAGTTKEIIYGVAPIGWSAPMQFTSDVLCDNAHFGGDPAVGYKKHCEIRDATPPPPDYPASFYTGPAGVNNPLPPLGKAFFGVTPPNNSCGTDHLQLCSTWQDNLAGFQYTESEVGKQFNLISDFQQQTCSLDMARLNGMRAEGLMQLSWEPSPNKPDQVIAGQADSCIQAVGAQLATLTSGNKVILRMYHEANGPCCLSWQHNSDGSAITAAQFKAAFQRTVDQLRIGGAFSHGMVATELNWAEGYFGNGDAFDEIAAYPGDAYVDWVSSDGYSTGAPEWCGGGTQHVCELAEYLTHGKCVTPPVPELQQTGFLCNATNVPVGTEATYRTEKPYAIAETGRGESTPAVQGSWMRYAGNYISQQMPDVLSVAYFDQDARTYGETQNWRLDTNATKLQGFSDWASMPRFLGP